MGCSKALDFAASITNPTFYWPMTSIVGGVSPATVGGNDMVLGKVSFATFLFTTGGSQAVVPGGLITNALSFPSSSFPAFIDVGKSNTPLGINSANDFTFRIWVKDPVGLFVGNLESRFDANPGDLNTHSGGAHVAVSSDSFYMHQPFPPAYVETQLDFSADDPGVAGWHRVIVSFKASTSTMLAKFDNDASRTTINPVGSSVGLLDLLLLFIDGFTTQLCECGVWANHVLTEPEMLLDWNGGAGRTFP